MVVILRPLPAGVTGGWAALPDWGSQHSRPNPTGELGKRVLTTAEHLGSTPCDVETARYLEYYCCFQYFVVFTVEKHFSFPNSITGHDGLAQGGGAIAHHLTAELILP